MFCFLKFTEYSQFYCNKKIAQWICFWTGIKIYRHEVKQIGLSSITHSLVTRQVILSIWLCIFIHFKKETKTAGFSWTKTLFYNLKKILLEFYDKKYWRHKQGHGRDPSIGQATRMVQNLLGALLNYSHAKLTFYKKKYTFQYVQNHSL